MEERNYLEKQIVLCTRIGAERPKRTFQIEKKISEGASCVCYEACYEAYHDASVRGVLKEFYPHGMAGLKRSDSGRLVFESGYEEARARFRERKEAYLKPYRMLLEAEQKSKTQELNTFIPYFEIYDSGSADGSEEGTFYVFTLHPELETFDKICEDIRRHPEQEPEHKLVMVLNAMEMLTKCVCALHCAGMVHRDIKPSNFGFVKFNGEVQYQTLSLFDIDSICSAFAKTDGVVGTMGYMEPEAGSEVYPADNRTDIYSIGATLYHAIIVSEEAEENGNVFHREQLERLQELVDSSRLIRASEANSHPRLRHILGRILKKCLCERDKRYACEDLLEDLRTALYYALPSEIAKKTMAGQKWVLTDAESYLDRNREKNSSLVIQYLLYQVPLYRSPRGDGAEMNVTVIGFGNYGRKFLDACLQAGQMCKKTLNVTVVSDEKEDWSQYLLERPQLKDFFNIDGSLEGDDALEAYGNLSFLEICRLRTNPGTDADEVLLEQMRRLFRRARPNYIFIALGEDELNLAVAGACENNAEIAASGCTVCYVSEFEKDAPVKNAIPVFVNADMTKPSLHEEIGRMLHGEIERMAFNTHLVWEKNLDVDFDSVRENFRDKYNHDSCVANVLSLKYKLYSVGIDMDEMDAKTAAEKFQKTVLENKNETLKNMLIWIEHRRWVTEKLCLGWRSWENVKECCRAGKTKDERDRKHICIVRSRPDRMLAKEWPRSKWDEASEAECASLDGLDRLSVNLHRALREDANKKKNDDKTDILSDKAAIMKIGEMTERNQDAFVAFQEWYACLKNIWNNDIAATRLYKGLKGQLLKTSRGLPADGPQSVRKYVEAFETEFYSVLAAAEYRDWKQDDVALIENIPFVLTYTEDVCMVIPLVAGEHSQVFENVSAMTVVNPKRVFYLALVEKKRDRKMLESALGRMIKYIRRKQLRAEIGLAVAYPDAASKWVTEEWIDGMKRYDGLASVQCIRTDGMKTAASEVAAYLSRCRRKEEFFAVEQNDTRMASILLDGGFYEKFPTYRFDSATMKFDSIKECEPLCFIRKRPFIRVADMEAFTGAFGVNNNQPEFFNDYENLWEKYRENTDAWKRLCEELRRYTDGHDRLVTLAKKQKPEGKTELPVYTYILPAACMRSAKKILDFIKKEKFAGPKSNVKGFTTDSCIVNIYDKNERKEQFDKLFSGVYALMDADAISVFTTNDNSAHVIFDNLTVSEAALPDMQTEECFRLLEYFNETGYVLSLKRISGNKVSFTFATRRIKELLTNAGKMPAVYTYHKAKATGAFDDVVSSCEVIRGRNGERIQKEFGCILTKGFRSLFVGCTACAEMKQGFYNKLSVSEKQFGINATGVLVADTHGDPPKAAARVNEIKRTRGSGGMNIVTVYKEEDIRNIGETLLKIIDGTYAEE